MENIGAAPVFRALPHGLAFAAEFNMLDRAALASFEPDEPQDERLQYAGVF